MCSIERVGRAPHLLRGVSVLAVGVLVLQLGLGAPALAAGGDLDPSFGADGKVVGNQLLADAVALQADGKIVVVGSKNARFAAARFDADGSLDPTFGGDGIVSTTFHPGRRCFEVANDVLVGSDGSGKIVAVGYSDCGKARFALVRYRRNGTLDPTFGVHGKVLTSFGDPASCNAIGFAGALAPDGKIVVAGDADCHGGFAVARYKTNGTLDPTFGGDGRVQATVQLGVFEQDVAGVAVQPDGKIVIGGSATYFMPPEGEGYPDYVLIRFKVSGALDDTFGGGDGKVTTKLRSPRCAAWGEAEAMALQPDGKIVLGGYADCADTVGGPRTARAALVRYRPNGALDLTFGDNGKVATVLPIEQGQDYVYALAIEPDGKIVASGTNGRFLLIRYRPGGRLDTSFGNAGMVQTVFRTGPGDKHGYAFDLAVQPDGKVVAVGGASSFGSAMARYLPS